MISTAQQSLERSLESLSFNLGTELIAALNDPAVLEVLVNPDKTVWVEKLGQGMKCIGTMEPRRSRMIIALVAASMETNASVEFPIIEGELPLDGSRFEGLLPPVVSNPSFTIRKLASEVFSLGQYVEQGIMPPLVRDLLHQAVQDHKNILVVGGTGSGKTTLVNGIIDAISQLCPSDRSAIIEDTPELQSNSKNTVFLRTSDFVGMDRLLRATMRLRPDRIMVGEVRGGEALTLLKSWNTGHPGGVATVHANSAYGGLTRLEQLISEATIAPMQQLIAEAVDMVLFISRTPKGRAIKEVINVTGFSQTEQKYTYEVLYEN